MEKKRAVLAVGSARRIVVAICAVAVTSLSATVIADTVIPSIVSGQTHVITNDQFLREVMAANVGRSEFRSSFVRVSAAAAQQCCRVCTTGKACGDTCIARDRTCHVGPGCACDG